MYRDEQDKRARSVGGANALAMAGALVDEDAPTKASTSAASTSTAAAAEAAKPRVLPNQKLGLLRALLAIGDLSHSLFILAQFPYLVPANLDLADLLNRLLAASIEPAYATISLAKSKAQYQDDFSAVRAKYVAPDKAGAPTPARPVNLTELPFPDPNKDFVFFFAEWKNRLPKAGDWEEVLETLEKVYAPLIGVFISRDFTLFSRLCRIIVQDLTVRPASVRASTMSWSRTQSYASSTKLY